MHRLPIIRSPHRHREFEERGVISSVALWFIGGVILLGSVNMGSVHNVSLWNLIGRMSLLLLLPLVLCIFPLASRFWSKVPAQCPQCQGKMYWVVEQMVSEDDTAQVMRRFYVCTPCGHEVIVEYSEAKGDASPI